MSKLRGGRSGAGHRPANMGAKPNAAQAGGLRHFMPPTASHAPICWLDPGGV